MKRWKALPLAAAAVMLILSARTLTAQEKTIDEAWFLITLGGQPLGTQHDIMRSLPPTEEGEPAQYQSVSTTNLVVKRLGVEIKMQTRTEYLETDEGVVAVKYGMFGDTGNIRVEGRVRGDELAIAVISPGRTVQGKIPWTPDILGPYGMTRLIEEKGLKEGEKLQFKSFLPDMQRVANVIVEVGGMVETKIGEENMRLRRIVMKNDVMPGIDTTALVDEKGNVYRARIPLAGGMELVRVDEKTAAEAAFGAEIMMQFMVRSDKKIERPEDVNNALYRLKGPNEALLALQLESDRQTVEGRENGAVTIRVKSESNPAKEGRLTDETLAPYLKPTTFVQSDDERIVKTARETIGEAAGLAAAHKLENWVHENIEEKTLEMGFATASEVYTSRAGDCTEHAVLLAALCRAVGIPARVADGLVYWRGMFGYHMWVEVYADGAWRAIDGAVPGNFTDATHISLGHSAMDISSLADSNLRLIRALGELSIEVVEYTHRAVEDN